MTRYFLKNDLTNSILYNFMDIRVELFSIQIILNFFN